MYCGKLYISRYVVRKQMRVRLFNKSVVYQSVSWGRGEREKASSMDDINSSPRGGRVTPLPTPQIIR